MSRATIQPLRIKSFRALWIASVVGYLGGFLHTVAASWLMLELTGSALWVGLMAGSSTLPVLLLACRRAWSPTWWTAARSWCSPTR
jgi:hypothetical protein